MKTNIFLPSASPELKQKLDRLIELSLPSEEKRMSSGAPVWTAKFFGVCESPYWQNLSSEQKSKFISENSKGILQEALAIEHAGIAYAQRMGLAAESQEERQYYMTVGREELEHLTWLRPFCDAMEPSKIPSFAQLIGQFILIEDRLTSMLLIQVLLEGWGIHYYGSLMENTDHMEIKKVFENILKDESRHHAGGILLFQVDQVEDFEVFQKSVQCLIDTIRIGPYQVAKTLAFHCQVRDQVEMQNLLRSIHAEDSTQEKLTILRRLLSKSLSAVQVEQFSWQPFSIEVMAQQLV